MIWFLCSRHMSWCFYSSHVLLALLWRIIFCRDPCRSTALSSLVVMRPLSSIRYIYIFVDLLINVYFIYMIIIWLRSRAILFSCIFVHQFLLILIWLFLKSTFEFWAISWIFYFIDYRSCNYNYFHWKPISSLYYMAYSKATACN